jgi:hypothetical protein
MMAEAGRRDQGWFDSAAHAGLGHGWRRARLCPVYRASGKDPVVAARPRSRALPGGHALPSPPPSPA